MKIVADMVAVLGADVVATMRGRVEMGTIVGGDTARAGAIHREVLERRRRVLDGDHTDTLRSIEDVEPR